ncbi:MAG: DUF2085 domain-containing protein [Anaerolineaceae bacterium]|nr:DUF2085 domain-containing protein [Anaerolineaceae bacterium]
MILIIVLLFVYLILALLAPILMKAGYYKYGKFLYRLYSNLCHQFAHRSWFLFGEQAYYPADPLKGNDILTIQGAFGVKATDETASREIIGNEKSGYKIAICQRDIAIYGMMFVFALIFTCTGKKINKIPFWLWFIFGVLPIGLDGTLQLLSTMNKSAPLIISYESNPIMRTITGAMFGLFTGWYLYPAIEETFLDDDDQGIN